MKQFKKDCVETIKLALALYAGVAIAYTTVVLLRGFLNIIF